MVATRPEKPGMKGKRKMSEARKTVWAVGGSVAAAIIIGALVFGLALPATISDLTYSQEGVAKSQESVVQAVGEMRVELQKVGVLAVQQTQLVSDMLQAERLIARLRDDLEALKVDMAATTAARFTVSDGAAQEARFVARYEKLSEQIVALERRLPDTLLKSIKPELNALKERLAALERKNG